jgi:hypothetical protein
MAASRRLLCAVCLAASLSACDEPLRLVLVEALEQGGTESGGSGGLGGLGATSGGGVGGTDVAGDAGAGGAFSGPPWEAPALYRASYASHAFPGQYLRRVAGEAVVAAVDPASASDKAAASFEIIPGIWDDGCISLRATDEVNAFFRHAGSRLHMHPYPLDGTKDIVDLFQADATYCVEPGVADPDGVSFRSVNYPQRLIHVHPNGEVWTDYIEDTPEFASESTFYRESALSDR